MAGDNFRGNEYCRLGWVAFLLSAENEEGESVCSKGGDINHIGGDGTTGQSTGYSGNENNGNYKITGCRGQEPDTDKGAEVDTHGDATQDGGDAEGTQRGIRKETIRREIRLLSSGLRNKEAETGGVFKPTVSRL